MQIATRCSSNMRIRRDLDDEDQLLDLLAYDGRVVEEFGESQP